jgi:hypothetical protein
VQAEAHSPSTDSVGTTTDGRMEASIQECRERSSHIEARAAENDLDSELKLRGMEPPYEEVRDDFERLMSAALAMAEDLRKDPVALHKRAWSGWPIWLPSNPPG